MKGKLTRQEQFDAAKATADRKAKQEQEPYAVVSHGNGFRAKPVMKVADATPLLYMTVTPSEWNRKVFEANSWPMEGGNEC